MSASPESRIVCTYASVYHLSRRSRVVTAAKKAGGIRARPLRIATKYSTIRVSNPNQNARQPLRTQRGMLDCAARGQGLPVGINKAQHQWLVYHGIWPLNSNLKKGRPGHKHVTSQAKKKAINKAFDKKLIPTRADLSQDMANAINLKHEFFDYCNWCPKNGMFEPQICSGSCRVCGPKREHA